MPCTLVDITVILGKQSPSLIIEHQAMPVNVVTAAEYGGQVMGLIVNQWKLSRLHLFFF
jgi:hypothetical protein